MITRTLNLSLLAGMLLLVACDRGEKSTESTVVKQTEVADTKAPQQEVAPKKDAAKSTTTPPVDYKLDDIARVVAVGDVHGDFDALKTALYAAQLIDSENRWIGQKTVLVQTGDLLDRGDDEQEIIDFLDQLGKEARAQGGNVLEIVGNHEAMNVQGDLRYVTPGGFKDFEDVEGLDLSDPRLARVPEQARARLAAFHPGGPYANKLADHHTIGIVNDSVFVHGGVLPEHVEYGVDKLNREVRAWMLGDNAYPVMMQGQQAPVWTRYYSAPKGQNPCPVLQDTLDKLKVKRMIVGHTPQMDGVRSACDGKLWLIDVGMAKHYGGKPAALEILKDGSTRVMEPAD